MRAALAVVIILVDLFVFRYHWLGPTLFGILCLLAGAALGRTTPLETWTGLGGVVHRVFILFFVSPLLAVGILCLAPPIFVDLPDNVTNSFMWETSTPDGRHYLGRGRVMQIFIGPVFMWFFGVFSAAVLCSFFVRPGSQENGGVDGEVSSPEAGGRAAAGVHPWAYTGGLYLILLPIMLRGILEGWNK